MSLKSWSEYLLTCTSPHEAESICEMLLDREVVKSVELIDKAKLIISSYSEDITKIGQELEELTGRSFEFIKLPGHQDSADDSMPAKIYI
jgi:hypothetical protein